MHRRMYEADWERRKEYLDRSIFTNPRALSPIYESPESRLRFQESSDPGHISPLPELIIERQRRYEDESEEFYNRLEVKMKNLYRRIFLGEIIDDNFNFGEIEITCEDQIPDYSYNDDGNAMRDDTVDDDVGNNNENDGERTDSDEDEAETLKLHHEHAADDTEVSTQISSEVAEETEPSEEPLAGIEGKEDEESSENNKSSNQESRTDERRNSSDRRLEDASSSSERGATMETIATNAIIERECVDTTSSSSLEVPEVMRRQKSLSTRDSFQRQLNLPDDHHLDLNIARTTMEHMNESSYNIIEMDVETETFQPLLRITTPLREASPILGNKRKLGYQTTEVPAKMSKVVQQGRLNDEIMRRVETASVGNMREMWTETSYHNNHVETQTDAYQRTDDYINVEVQTNVLEEFEHDINGLPAGRSNAETQTEMPDTNDAYTQTNNYNFEYWRVPLGFRFYFFF